ncbi:unnamed protein product [Timema podura]|uniref:Uncharacterized protein n=1 Tax=Timema podura TaxID=61482 RepID=A0ABN7P8Z2_TIMPD|nr:unnamed protein product [Timema podura]
MAYLLPSPLPGNGEYMDKCVGLIYSSLPMATNMISVEALSKIIDTTQLTSDLEGTLHYDHSQWIDVRLALEDFVWQAADLLDRLDDLQEDLSRSDFADDVAGAKHSIDLHADMKKKIMKAPVEDIDLIGQKLLQRLLLTTT